MFYIKVEDNCGTSCVSFLNNMSHSSKTNSLAPTDITLLSILFYNLLKSSTNYEAKNPKISKAKGMKWCWFSTRAFSCFLIFFPLYSLLLDQYQNRIANLYHR